GRFLLDTSAGKRFLARTVFIAGGVGSFQSRPLKLAGIDRFLDTQLFYRVRDAEAFRGRRVVVAGGGDSALDWAIALAGTAASVAAAARSARVEALSLPPGSRALRVARPAGGRGSGGAGARAPAAGGVPPGAAGPAGAGPQAPLGPLIISPVGRDHPVLVGD